MNKYGKWQLRWHKLTHWEFWPFGVLYFPVNFFYAWLALRCRSFFFFTSANPGIDFGGMMGESKMKIYDLIPKQFLPDTRLVDPRDFESALDAAKAIGFPVICKPDVGERGRLVEKISNEAELKSYADLCPVPFLVQEFVNYPVELGVFYVRHPHQSTGRVTSLVKKEFMEVTGDGKLTVNELLSQNPRALTVLKFSHARFSSLLSQVPAKGEKLLIEGIGNHSRGTTFLNANTEISEALHEGIDQLSKQIHGFYFGRFDLRCQSIDDLAQLKNFKIMELNGAGAEPTHIYHPGGSLLRAYRDICWHLAQLATISRANKKAGVPYWNTRRGWRKLQEAKAHSTLISSVR